ncbi:MAG: hypothetical protein WC498_02805 [Candidatus Saccharimonadales bacterium]
MKLIVFYRPNSEHARLVEEFIHDLQRVHNVNPSQLDIMDVDSRDGVAMASLYDVMMYPSFLVVADDGSIMKSWEGTQLPLMNEIASYTFSY